MSESEYFPEDPPNTEDLVEVVQKPTKQGTSNEPVQAHVDRDGRDYRVRSRTCYCPPDADTDCRFHSVKEPGWAVCPHTNAPKHKGRQLWSLNPEFGKPPTKA